MGILIIKDADFSNCSINQSRKVNEYNGFIYGNDGLYYPHTVAITSFYNIHIGETATIIVKNNTNYSNTSEDPNYNLIVFPYYIISDVLSFEGGHTNSSVDSTNSILVDAGKYITEGTYTFNALRECMLAVTYYDDQDVKVRIS